MGRRRTLKKHSSKRRQRLLSIFARRGGDPPVVGVNGYPTEGNVASLRKGFMDIAQNRAFQRKGALVELGNPLKRGNAEMGLHGSVIRAEDLPDLGASPASRSRRRSRRRSRQRSRQRSLHRR